MSSTFQKFIDETFTMMTGIGEMKVSEAVFLYSCQDACDTPALNEDKTTYRQVIALAYQGRNIIKMCAHLPQNSTAETYAKELWRVANKIDNLVFGLNSSATTSDSETFENSESSETSESQN